MLNARSLRDRLDAILPVPMAAPETPRLRAQRLRLIAAAVMFSVAVLLVMALPPSLKKISALFAGSILFFLLLEGSIWARRKHRADEDYLEGLATCGDSSDEG